ncbi:MAG TPA: cell division protein FtsW, partial [Alphaproteobacteria bacterium]
MTAARPYIPRPGERAPVAPRFKQSRATRLRIWWREIDRVLLTLVLAVMVLGSIAVAAASPASARRLSGAEGKLDDL